MQNQRFLCNKKSLNIYACIMAFIIIFYMYNAFIKIFYMAMPANCCWKYYQTPMPSITLSMYVIKGNDIWNLCYIFSYKLHYKYIIAYATACTADFFNQGYNMLIFLLALIIIYINNCMSSVGVLFRVQELK